MEGTVLRCKEGFSAWGHSYNTGDAIPAEHYTKWHPGTLETRLENGGVEFDSATPEEAAALATGPGDGVVLMALGTFRAFGHEYQKGSRVETEHLEKWPEGTLQTRLNGKDVSYVPEDHPDLRESVPVSVPGETPDFVEVPAGGDDDEDDEDDEEDIDKMTKPQLVAYAKSNYDVDLDIALAKPVLVERVKELVAKA